MPVIQRFQAAYRWMKVKITQLNLYTIDGRETDPYDLTTAIISTRIYLLFLGLSITNLIIFTSLQIQIQSFTVENPSRETFEDLHNKYSTTLRCPCSQIAINYGSFVSLAPKYHPVLFPPKNLIGKLINSLMIEDWGRNIQYDQYYEQCAPRLCSYRTFYRKNALYVLTKLIGLIGGLTIGLKIMVSIIVKWLRKRVQPTIEDDHQRGKLIKKKRSHTIFFWSN